MTSKSESGNKEVKTGTEDLETLSIYTLYRLGEVRTSEKGCEIKVVALDWSN
jgi:hypothetical protein